MRWTAIILMFSGLIWAQDDQMSPQQKKLYTKVTQSVAAPCCSNMIPVAFHESQWAFDIRDFVAARVLAGDGERAIFKQLKELEFGSDAKHVTLTIPERDGLGYLAWASPVIIILLGAALVWILFRRGRKTALSDDELLERYGPLIRARVAVFSERT